MNDVFVGSSSEALPIAKAIAKSIDKSDLFCALPWWKEGVFREGRSYLDSLFEILKEVDYAIIIACPTDNTVQRGIRSLSPRDNVIFEYGLFAGRNGRSNVAFFNIGNAKIMTDLAGIAVYGIRPTEAEMGNLSAVSVERLNELVSNPVSRCLDRFLCAPCETERLITDLCWRVVPLSNSAHINLLQEASHIRRKQVNLLSIPLREVSKTIEKYCQKENHLVGRDHKKTEVPYYVDLSSLNDNELVDLAHTVAYLIREELERISIKPSRIGLHYRRGKENQRSTTLMSKVAQHLHLPLVFVDLDEDDPRRIVKSTIFQEEEVIFLHDFTVSGNTPMHCINHLRARNAKVNYLFSFVVHEARKGEINTISQRGGLFFKPLWCLNYNDNKPEIRSEVSQV